MSVDWSFHCTKLGCVFAIADLPLRPDKKCVRRIFSSGLELILESKVALKELDVQNEKWFKYKKNKVKFHSLWLSHIFICCNFPISLKNFLFVKFTGVFWSLNFLKWKWFLGFTGVRWDGLLLCQTSKMELFDRALNTPLIRNNYVSTKCTDQKISDYVMIFPCGSQFTCCTQFSALSSSAQSELKLLMGSWMRT